MMRIAHATDIHWFVPPRLSQLPGKRLVGSANLYLRGRRHSFSDSVQTELVRHIRAAEPDLVVITGDLTAQATPEEFHKARQALEPVLSNLPTFIIPGNHDVYTRGAAAERRITRYLGDFMGLDAEPLGRHDQGSVTVLGLDPNRATLATASGWVPEEQLRALRTALDDPALIDQFVVLATHYPPVDRHGELYDVRGHGLLNVRALVDVLQAASKRPDLVLCGHKHHGYRSALNLPDGTAVAVINCGSSGHSYDPNTQGGAAMCIYGVEAAGLSSVERFLHDGQRFVPEPGGAFASRR